VSELLDLTKEQHAIMAEKEKVITRLISKVRKSRIEDEDRIKKMIETKYKHLFSKK
jgi:hypothetical protein